jgi:hypothetical protein
VWTNKLQGHRPPATFTATPGRTPGCEPCRNMRCCKGTDKMQIVFVHIICLDNTIRCIMLNQCPLLNVILKHVSLKFTPFCMFCGACKAAVQRPVTARRKSCRGTCKGRRLKWITFVGRPHLSRRTPSYRRLISGNYYRATKPGLEIGRAQKPT